MRGLNSLLITILVARNRCWASVVNDWRRWMAEKQRPSWNLGPRTRAYSGACVGGKVAFRGLWQALGRSGCAVGRSRAQSSTAYRICKCQSPANSCTTESCNYCAWLQSDPSSSGSLWEGANNNRLSPVSKLLTSLICLSSCLPWANEHNGPKEHSYVSSKWRHKVVLYFW